MPRILVTRRLPSSVLATLETAGSVECHAEDVALSPDELRRRLAVADAAVTMLNDQMDARTIDAAPGLKVVANVAVGYNNVDVAHAASRGVVVTNTPGVLTHSVADFTWGLILAVTRRIAEGDRLVRRGAWEGWAFDFMLGAELRHKQLGLVGFGRIARAVAEIAAAFGMRVAYASRRDAAHAGSEHMSLDRLLNTSDVVSIHVPLSAETKHLIDKRALTRMKRSAYLVNTSRGPVVDEEALAWALREHLIAGAALDVYEREPVVHADLLSLENVVLAPHLGSGTTETRTAMADLAARNVVEVLAGRRPLTPVTP
jgi:glyoxylate reductase